MSLQQYVIGEGRKKLEEYREVMRETLIGSKEILEKELPDMRDYLKDIRDYFYSPTRFVAKLVGAIVGASSIALASLGVNTKDGQSFFGGDGGFLGSKSSFYALGGAGGAALGGILGSVLGPQGAVVGALLGGVTGLTAVAVTDFWDELTSAYDKVTAAANSVSDSVDKMFGSGANIYLWGGMAGALIGGIAGLAAGPLGFPIGAMLGLKIGVITGLTTAWYFNNQEDIKKAYNTVVATVDSINKGIDDVFGEGAHNYLWDTVIGSLTFGVMGLLFGGPVGAALGLTAGAIAGASYKWYFDNIETVKKTYNYHQGDSRQNFSLR